MIEHSVRSEIQSQKRKPVAASPFYPGQPVPANLFVGRAQELKRIERALLQVSSGGQRALYLAGDYGIGKSSLTNYLSYLARTSYELLPVHVMLGGANDLESVATRTVEAIIQATSISATLKDKTHFFLGRYLNKQDMFGFTLNLEALRADAPGLTSGFLPFLGNYFDWIRDEYTRGLVLIFDEIDSISEQIAFAHFLKTLVDSNGMNNRPLPLLIVLCGVEERRQTIIQNHNSIDRIFEVINILPLSHNESIEFFNRAFQKAGLEAHPQAVELMAFYGKGLPKVIHVIGESVYWTANSGTITVDIALEGIMAAADEVRRRFVDEQVYKVMRAADYKGFLNKITSTNAFQDPFQT